MPFSATRTRVPNSTSLTEDEMKERMAMLRFSLLLPRNPIVRPRPLGRIDHLCDFAMNVAIVGVLIAVIDTFAFYFSP